MITSTILLSHLPWALIGLVVGLNLGITGSGGALISIPLFTYFFSYDFKIASFYSLIAVISGAFLNLLPIFKKTKFKISFLMTVGSIAGSYLSSNLKQILPMMILKILFAGVCLYSLYHYVKNIKGSSTKIEIRSPIIHLVSGFFLGNLTTLTGLGGGVVLMPWLIGPLGLNSADAIPTSLFTILIASLISFSIQLRMDVTHQTIDINNIIFLVLGAALASLLIKFLLQKISAESLAKLRKFSFTLVILLALISLFKS